MFVHESERIQKEYLEYPVKRLFDCGQNRVLPYWFNLFLDTLNTGLLDCGLCRNGREENLKNIGISGDKPFGLKMNEDLIYFSAIFRTERHLTFIGAVNSMKPSGIGRQQ